MENLITENIDIWTTAQIQKNGTGRGNGSANQSLYGIKKLRELILELAVRGKLVSQDPNDEPASVLLEKIAKEKTRLVKEGKINKQEHLPEITEDEKLFELPIGWEWQRLGDIGITQTGGTPSKNSKAFFGNDIPFIKPGDIYPTYIDYANEGLSFEGQTALGRTAPSGAILMVCIGTIGKCNSIDRNCAFNQQINAVTPYINMTKYLLVVLRSNYFQGIAWARSSSTTIAILNKGKWADIVLPVAPLAEQQCIVAKVDELMALCDKLEQQQTDNNATEQALVETLLSTLTAAANSDEFNKAWQRIAENFDTLFTTEQSIDQLKQTILQLAVMGKLVPQDPKDEPASVLLEKIAKEKARLIKEGKIKKEKSLPEITENKEPFKLPQGWKWIQLGRIATFENGDRSNRYPKESDLQQTGIPFFGAKDMVDGLLSFDNGLRFISEAKFNELSNGKLIDKDFVILLRGTVGKMAMFLANSEFSSGFINAQMIIVRFVYGEIFEFFNLYSISDQFQSMIEAKTTGSAVRQMPANVLVNFLIPLPPLAEQHHIVAKVDELMALCDALKVRLQEAQTTQIQLADAIVEQAVA